MPSSSSSPSHLTYGVFYIGGTNFNGSFGNFVKT
jgi:hypothetical protein